MDDLGVAVSSPIFRTHPLSARLSQHFVGSTDPWEIQHPAVRRSPLRLAAACRRERPLRVTASKTKASQGVVTNMN